jgi:hypothetical protein
MNAPSSVAAYAPDRILARLTSVLESTVTESSGGHGAA